MDLRFVITVTEHRILGYILAPYFVHRDKKPEILTVYDRVTVQNLNSYTSILSAEEVQLVKLIEEYNDQQLLRLFSKNKKETSRDFIARIDDDLLDKIRPFIERRLAKCVEILQYSQVPVYQKILQNSIYESDKLELVFEEGNTIFNFVRHNEGLRYHLSIEHNEKELKLTGTEGIIVSNEPCLLMLEDRLFFFKDINGNKLLPFFDKEHVNIGKATEKKYLETFVKNAIRDFKVRVEGIEIKDLASQPRAVLSVEADMAGKMVLVLKFVYEKNTIYYANKKTNKKVTCEFEGEKVIFYRLQRNYEIENDRITKLLSLGLSNQEGAYFTPFKKVKKHERVGYELINWINFNGHLLKKHGIDVVQNKIDKDFYLEDIEFKMEVSDKENDWFDIKAIVVFDEFKIPFTEFAEHIKNGIVEYALPNGKIVVLPEEWFENYRDIFTFSKVREDALQLDKQHFALLNKSVGRITGGAMKDKLSGLLETKGSVEPTPEKVNAELRNYQQEGYTWMYRLYLNGFGGCLADDMGLGKTLQTLTVLQKIKAELPTNGAPKVVATHNEQKQLSLFAEPALEDTEEPTQSSATSLIVVPTSLVYNWMNEIKKFIPSLKATTYVGSNRGDLSEVYEKNNIIITSYGILRNDLDKFQNLEFLYLILDESQMIKNPTSKTYMAVMKIDSENRLVLTGTPIENSLSDLWSQMNFLNPGLLGNMSFFRNEFLLPIEKKNDEEKRAKLQQIIAPFILRRTKTEVVTELPPVIEQVVQCELNEPQEVYYEREKSKARNMVLESIGTAGIQRSTVMILQSLMKLRQIANHPQLIDEDYVAGSGKFDEVKRNIRNLRAEGHKALIFSSFVKHLELVESFLKKEKIDYAFLTGQTKDREAQVKKFQEKEDCQFFLISLKAGGVGLNLTAAEYVLILDPWWNPAAESQAIARAHRIGQEKQVIVYRFITGNTLEDKILKLQRKKSDLADAFVNDNSLNDMSKDEVLELFE